MLNPDKTDFYMWGIDVTKLESQEIIDKCEHILKNNFFESSSDFYKFLQKSIA